MTKNKKSSKITHRKKCFFMPTVISEISLYFRRILYDLEQKKDGDITDKYLIALLRKRLRTLDEKKWLTTKVQNRQIFRIFCQDLSLFQNVSERAILFILFDMRLSEIDDDFLDIIIHVVQVFNIMKINPYNYASYMNMFCDKEIIELILDRPEYNFWGILAAVISLVSQEQLNTGNYEEAKKYLYSSNNNHYSPVFANFYTVENVYETIKYIMTDESLALVFTIKDRKGLALLARLKDYSTTRFKIYFRNRITELEDTFFNQKVSLVKAICAIAPELYLVAQRMKYEDKGSIGEGSTKKI